jgi:hypothetical protein
VSGPARRPLVERPARRRSPEYAGIALGLIEALGRLSEHRLLDRLIRGRTWIGLVAFALIGIVTLQLGLLRLNAGIGHALQKKASLQRENAALSIENSELAAGDLVESSASRLGMEVVPAGALRFLTARPATDASRAAGALSAPRATGEGSSGAAAAPATGEGSSGAAVASSGASAGAEGSAPSSGSQPSSPSSGSEAEASNTPSAEAGAPQASTSGQSKTESSAGQSTSGSETAPAPATGSGSSEPSGGTQAGSTGR